MRKILTAVAVFAFGACGHWCNASAITLTNASATFSQDPLPADPFNVARAIDGSFDTSTGWAIHPNETTPESAVFRIFAPVSNSPSTMFTFTMSQLFAPGTNDQHTIGDFRFSVTADANPDAVTTPTGDWSFLNNVTFSDTAAETPVSISPTGKILLPASGPGTVIYTVTGITSLQNITGIRLEVIPDASLPNGASGRQPSNGNFVLSELQASAVAAPTPSSALGGMALLLGLGALRFWRTKAA